LKGMAGTTGLEPAASAVTGQRSNQLNYVPLLKIQDFAKTRSRCGFCGKGILCKLDKEFRRWRQFLDEPPPNRLQISRLTITNTMLTHCKHYAC
jgi:hypothetical protein